MHPRLLSICLPLIATLLIAGCVSLEQAAPPVAMLGLPEFGTQLASLQKGRVIYITRCAKCHSVEPVKKYTRSDWDNILPKMAVKTKLTTADDALVRAYVLAVLSH